MNADNPTTNSDEVSIAIIGMACRFPMAKNVEEYWQNLRDGRNCISLFGPDEADTSSVLSTDPSDPAFVGAAGLLEDSDKFDASFFGFSPREAELIDPQHRILLECAWECLEHGGHAKVPSPNRIAVFAGASTPTYLLDNILSNESVAKTEGPMKIITGNDKDYVASRISYKLNLQGPSINVQSACATSLLAVHLACQNLLSGESNIALAGGVCVRSNQMTGYVYREGSIESKDGYCRAFDAEATGTVWGNGAGIVLLKRLDDARRDGDTIYAIIRGSAANNDGSSKVGYTAPSVEGQRRVILDAHAVAGIHPENVSYVETHGTGTPVGDPIEVKALTDAFRGKTSQKQYCAIGSVKPSIGHLDAAAGIASLIKASLALHHKEIPASLNFEAPNPAIEFDDSPFYVNRGTRTWKVDGTPRIAGVSAFGVGGTNVHLVLEESPSREAEGGDGRYHVVPLSARSADRLQALAETVAERLEKESSLPLPNLASTLQFGRAAFRYRSAVVSKSLEDARLSISNLTRGAEPILKEDPPVIFMFPGQGSQYPGMARHLYETEPAFRETLDQCFLHVGETLASDLKELLVDDPVKVSNPGRIDETRFTQPALFAVEYSLATLLDVYGIKPFAMIGHSIGEYVAACLSGVMSLEDAMRIVVERGRLMNEQDAGGMSIVHLPVKECEPRLSATVAIAAINTPESCVVAGPFDDLEAFEEKLDADDVGYRRLNTSHAFHSAMMDPMLSYFSKVLEGHALHDAAIPFVSNVTGDWIEANEASSPSYWVRHVRHSVQFAAGIEKLLEYSDAVYLEVGPGLTLTRAVRRQLDRSDDRRIVGTLGAADHDGANFYRALGSLWTLGKEIRWESFHRGKRPQRIALPTYPFKPLSYWISPTSNSRLSENLNVNPSSVPLTQWFYALEWKRDSVTRPPRPENLNCKWLVFLDDAGRGQAWVSYLKTLASSVAVIRSGQAFREIGAQDFVVRPGDREDLVRVRESLSANGALPDRVLFLWALDKPKSFDAPSDLQHFGELRYLYSLIFVAQVFAVGSQESPFRMDIVGSGLFNVLGHERVDAIKSLMFGPTRNIPLEFRGVTCKVVDVAGEETAADSNKDLKTQVFRELEADFDSIENVALRKGFRWIRFFSNQDSVEEPTGALPFSPGAVYLITGGLGGIGLAISEHIAKLAEVTFILTGRSSIRGEDLMETTGSDGEIELTIAQRQSVERLRSLGSDVVYFRSDISKSEDVDSLFRFVSERYGALNGIVHAAGTASQETIRGRQSYQRDPAIDSKVAGTMLLYNGAQAYNMDFFALSSSIASESPAYGQNYYGSANAFMDGFAHSNSDAALTPISLDWGVWKDVGMAQRFEDEYGMLANSGASLEAYIGPVDGAKAFQIALRLRNPQTVILSTDLHVYEHKARQKDRDEEANASIKGRGLHPRPDVSTEFEPPDSDDERLFAAVVCGVLGLEEVGIHDKFYELGGHSLLFADIAAKLYDQHDLSLPLKFLYENLTVAEQAANFRAYLEEEAPRIQAIPRRVDTP